MQRNFLKITFIATLALAFKLTAAESASDFTTGPEQTDVARHIKPMDTTGLERGVANVLRNYYKKNFTDEENWGEIESIRFDGSIHYPEQVIDFTAFKKKPDLIKVVLYPNDDGRIIMAYDGEDAWMLNTFQPGAQPQSFAPKEARNFIRDAATGGHLLYPSMEGKTVELLGTATENGERLYDLRVTLPDGQQIRLQLDMTTLAEIRQIATNHVNGNEEVTTHSDFREIEGVRFPFASTLTVDGEQVHQVRLDRVQTNLGVMPWIFSRPSESNATSLPALDAESPLSPQSPVLPDPKPNFGDPAEDSVFNINPSPSDLDDPIEINFYRN